MKRYVVSACLAGIECRYTGGGTPHARVLDLVRAGEALPVCPEVLGGLGVPRPPCELVDGRARTPDGRDCHDAYLAGAAEALRQAREAGCTTAVLKARSPSCGVGCVYDGTFTHTRIPRDGVFAALLRKAGFVLLTEEELPPGGSAAQGDASSGSALPPEGPKKPGPLTEIDVVRKPRTGCGSAAPSESGFRAFPPGGSAADGGAHAAQRDASSV